MYHENGNDSMSPNIFREYIEACIDFVEYDLPEKETTGKDRIVIYLVYCIIMACNVNVFMINYNGSYGSIFVTTFR